MPVSFGVAEGDFVPAPAPGLAGLNPPLFPLNGVAVPLGLPVPDGLTPPGGVEAPNTVAPGFGVAAGDAPPLKSFTPGVTVGFGRFDGVGFSLTNLDLSSLSVFVSIPFQPLSTTGFAFLIVATGSLVAVGFRVVPGPVTFSTPLLMFEPGVFPF